MDIRTLRYAVTLSEELHFGRAARRHFISEQPFGAHIRRLELSLGYKLFERTSRRVGLTRDGEKFIVLARELLAQLDDLSAIPEGIRRSPDEPLRVGVLGFGAGEHWRDLIAAVRRQFPDLRLRHLELTLDDQFDALFAGRVDVALTQYFGPIDGLCFDVIGSSPRVVVVPADSDLAHATRLEMSDVAGADWLTVTRGEPHVLSWAGDAAGGAGPEVTIPASIPNAVAMTGRISLFADAARHYFLHPGVRFVPFGGMPLETAIATREGDSRPAVAAFRVAAQSLVHITLPEGDQGSAD